MRFLLENQKKNLVFSLIFLKNFSFCPSLCKKGNSVFYGKYYCFFSGRKIKIFAFDNDVCFRIKSVFYKAIVGKFCYDFQFFTYFYNIVNFSYQRKGPFVL